ncbi:MAG: hypothetical protein M3N17_06790, partial [Actinomycetota bacterium]|nr:hypothetical protein [Actinomycetota bacterium]
MAQEVLDVAAAEELVGGLVGGLVEHRKSQVGVAVQECGEGGGRRGADLGLRVGDEPTERGLDEAQPRGFLGEEVPDGERGGAAGGVQRRAVDAAAV